MYSFWVDLYNVTDSPGMNCMTRNWKENWPTKLLHLFYEVVHLGCTRDRRCQNHWAGIRFERSQTHVCGENNRATVKKEEELVLHSTAKFHANCFSLLQKSCDWLQKLLIGWRLSQQILLDREKFNNKENDWLNFIMSLTWSTYCKIVFCFWWRHIVH